MGLSIHLKWSEVKVTQSCPTLCDPMDYTVNGILQAKILECVAYPFSRGSSRPRNQTGVSCIVGRFFRKEQNHPALLTLPEPVMQKATSLKKWSQRMQCNCEEKGHLLKRKKHKTRYFKKSASWLKSWYFYKNGMS